MPIVVRLVEERDLPALREHQARPDLNLVDVHFETAADGSMLFAAAFEDEQPLGTALLDVSEDYQWTPELRNMWVYPEARRRGAGRALSRWLEDQARRLGHEAVFLAVDPGNEKAIPLYISLGYSPTGEHMFIDDPEVPQVDEAMQPAKHYAIYKKSLSAH